MPSFQLTAIKTLVGLPNGMQIDKGEQFVINIPTTCTSPFGNPIGRNACISQLKAHGYDFSEHPTWLNSTFNFKKI